MADEHDTKPDDGSSSEQGRRAERLREWGFDVEAFEAKARQSLEEARGDLTDVTDAIRSALAATRQTLLEIQRARAPIAAELRTGFERAWEDLEKAFEAARQRMKETREEAAGGAPDQPKEG